MFYPVKAFGEEYEILVVVDSVIGSSRPVAASDVTGTSWQVYSEALPTSSGYYAVCRGNNLWVAVGENNTFTCTSSDNGENWTQGGALARGFGRVCFNPVAGLFVGAVRSGYSATSSDGLTWTFSSNYTFTNDICNIVYSEALDLYVILTGANNNDPATHAQSFTSTDGLVWQTNSFAGKYVGFYDFCWSPELEIFCAIAGPRQYGPPFTYPRTTWTSTDGVNWTENTNVLPDKYDVRAITWSPRLSKFIVAIMGIDGATTDKYIHSPDGLNWTIGTLPITGRYIDVVDNGGIVAMLESGNTSPNNVATSPDLTTWTARNMGATLEWSAMATKTPT